MRPSIGRDKNSRSFHYGRQRPAQAAVIRPANRATITPTPAQRGDFLNQTGKCLGRGQLGTRHLGRTNRHAQIPPALAPTAIGTKKCVAGISRCRNARSHPPNNAIPARSIWTSSHCPTPSTSCSPKTRAFLKPSRGTQTNRTSVRLITQAFKRGGRLFYVGAGTSGRLGVLDASECPPTFRTNPDLVQGIIAGGQTALWRSVEGAEDDPASGARAIDFRKVTRHDVVVGIAASGRTPFVWAPWAKHGNAGQNNIAGLQPLLENSARQPARCRDSAQRRPGNLNRLHSPQGGTATKLILNIFTTLAMVQTGKVVGNLMVDLNPSNIKLRDRAVRIVQELKGVDYAEARTALEKSRWVIKQACAG